MNIKLFESITTEDALKQLEANGEKYTGLYVDMDNKEERKYVKDQAVLIKDMLKKLDRSRIDITKNFKADVEAEAKMIRERLEEANKPFTDLIGAHNAERKKILDAKKAREAAEELAKQIASDHELALFMNDKWDAEKEQREADRLKAQQEHDKEVARKAVEAANKKEAERITREANERLARERDTEHKRVINRGAAEALIQSVPGIGVSQAKDIVIAINEGRIPNVSIRY